MTGEGRARRRVIEGPGHAISSVERLVDDHGVLDLRQALDVTGFGLRALVLPAGASSRPYRVSGRQEVHLVYRGRVCIELDDVDWFVLQAGGLARIDAGTVRRLRNVGGEEAIVLAAEGPEDRPPEGGSPGWEVADLPGRAAA